MRWAWLLPWLGQASGAGRGRAEPPVRRLVTDGGDSDTDGGEGPTPAEEESEVSGATGEGRKEGSTEGEDDTDEEDGTGPVDRSSVEIAEAGEAAPADPKWEKPDPDDIPEFEVGAEGPMTRRGDSDRGTSTGSADPTAGMPNMAGSPGTRIREEGTESYVVALELCARLPDDIRLPEDAAETVPAAVEAELENDVQAFAAAEFDNDAPHVETLDFEEVDGDIWLRLRLGVPPTAFDDLDPEAIRAHALQQLEGLF